MSYAKNYKRTYLFRVYPNICQKMMELQRGEDFTLRFDAMTDLARMADRIYSFQHSYFGMCKMCVTKARDDIGDKLIISYPAIEVKDVSE